MTSGAKAKPHEVEPRSALRVGLFHRQTSVDLHEQDSAGIATRLSAKGSACLRAPKSATTASGRPLESAGEAGFNRVLVPPKCEVCGYEPAQHLSACLRAGTWREVKSRSRCHVGH
jgi:hypothetical protein